MLLKQGYSFVGSPAIVTGDRALHRLIVRAIPPVLRMDRKMAFGLAPDGLSALMAARIGDILAQVQVRSDVTEKDGLIRVTNLFDCAKTCCADERERQALDEIYADWWRPGFGREIELS